MPWTTVVKPALNHFLRGLFTAKGMSAVAILAVAIAVTVSDQQRTRRNTEPEPSDTRPPTAVKQSPSLSEVRDGKFSFYLTNGSPAVGYVETAPNRIELYTPIGVHDPHGRKILPVTQEIVARYKEQIAEQGSSPVLQGTIVTPTLESIENGAFQFFDHNGAPVVGYVRDNEGVISLFKPASGNDSRGRQILPVTIQIVAEYTEQLRSRQKAALLERYLNDPKSTQVRSVILIVNDQSKPDDGLTKAVSGRFARPIDYYPPYFRHEFVSDEAFEKVFMGDLTWFRELEIDKRCDRLVLGKVTTESRIVTSAQNITYIEGTLLIRIFSPADARIIEDAAIPIIASAFTPARARAIFRENLITAIQAHRFKN